MEPLILGEKMKNYPLCVVKRRTGECQPYDERKVYASVYAACYVVRRDEKECERIAEAIAKKITSYVKGKKEITSHSIHILVVKEFRKHDKDAAFMYDTHKDIS